MENQSVSINKILKHKAAAKKAGGRDANEEDEK
jgi:hypothetical protein